MTVQDIKANQTVEQLIRAAGICGVLGGPALAAAYFFHPSTAPPEIVSSSAWIWIHVGFMASLLGGVFLLIALMARYFQAGGGVLGFAGFAMAIISLIFVFGLDYAEVFIFPVLAITHPEVVIEYGDGTMMPSIAFAFPVTGVVFLFGFVMVGWFLYKTSVIGRTPSIMTIAGTTLFFIGLSGFAPMFVVKIGAALFGASLVWLGLILLKPTS